MSGAFGGTSGGHAFGTGGGTPQKKHHSAVGKVAHGVGEFTGHLLGDARDMAVGLPTGMAMLVRHPIGSLEQMGKTTWQDWSPLFQGNFAEFGHNFMAHPLAPILDIAGLVTGGAGLAARGGLALEAAGAISKESRLAKLGRGATEVVKIPGAPEAYRHFDQNPATRLRQRASVAFGHKLAESAPSWFGRTAHVAEGHEDTMLRVGPQGSVTPHDLQKVTEIKTGRIRDLSDAGYVERHVRKQESYRAGATRAMIGAQLATFVKAGEDISKNPARVTQEIERHGRQQLVDHAYTVSHEDAKRLKPGFTFVKAKHDALPAVHDLEGFKRVMEGFAPRHTTTSMGQAARDANGHYLVVHKRAVLAYGEEGKRSATFLTKLYKYPTQGWKYAVLATRPAYFVNNAVGNTFMTMATLGPMGFARGLSDAYRQVHGEEHAARSLVGAEKALKQLHGDWQDKWYLGVHQGFGQEAQMQLKLHERIPGHGRSAQVVKVAEQGFYPITHKVADVFLRRVMINSIMRDHSAVQRLVKDEKLSFDQAAERVSRDPAVRDRVQEEVNNALGDYHHLNPLEQHVRQFVPFYTWDRAIMRHGVHLALNKPDRTAVGAEVGAMGTQETEKVLGDIPNFMKGLLNLPGHGKDGRARVLSTQGLNPYASIPDVLDTAGAAVGLGDARPGEAVASQVNPIITGLIESMTGQSLLSGAQLPDHGGGIVGRTAANVVGGLPQMKLLDTLLSGEAQPRPNARTGKVTNFLYRKDARAQIAALLGVPVKELDKERAHDMARRENNKRKSRRHRGAFGG